MARITAVENFGTLLGIWIKEDGDSRLFTCDPRMGSCALENLQEDARQMASGEGLSKGFLDFLEVTYEVEPWGGLSYLAPAGYDAEGHRAWAATRSHAA